jgi:outer membrane protein OmpA-like peptidoglycan-associated protein
MGGFDLFMAHKNEEGKFVNIKNLGYPINTAGDETGLIVNAKGDKAYFSSDINKENRRDIFQFDLPQSIRPIEVSYLKGVVFDEQTLIRLKANFELYNLKDGSLVSQSQSEERTGEFLLCIPTNQDYMLNVEKKSYLFYSDNFALKGIHHIEEPFIKDIPLKPIEEGKTIVLKNIFYETDSYALKPESVYELNKVVRFLMTNPSIEVEISGHTDNVGTEAYNLNLSKKRAQSVVDYLVDKGIDPTRLKYKGYGYSIPIDTNDTPEGRANNRRTELKVLRKSN